MELKPGYKQTEVGVIPVDWNVSTVSVRGDVLTGKALARFALGDPRPYLRTKNVFDGKIILDDVLTMPMTETQFSTFEVLPGDVLLNEGQTLELVGRCAIYDGEYAGRCAFQNQLIRFRANNETSSEYAAHKFRFCQQTGIFSKIALQTTSVAHLGGKRFERLLLAWPSKAEQEAIADALSDADALIASLEQLIAKKRLIKQGAMQELLTGQRRLPGFSGEWELYLIEDIATQKTDKNADVLDMPVLTCSKHHGFVDSLSYFKNQVFSKDLSGYKLIERGQIGYPANHVEEGSIGLQELYDVALVSPIYVVFQVEAGVSSYFLHRLLKLEQFTYEFQSRMNASVDRRGSLRWPEFSKIKVMLPPTMDEQIAISNVLTDLETELAALEAKLAKARQVKQGMMQELLTGRIRLLGTQAKQTASVKAAPEKPSHNQHINEAVIIATLASEFASESFPLGRMRYTKLSYLLHRYKAEETARYRKKAAGPYNPGTRYGGAEKIAVNNHYVRQHKSGKFSGFVKADNVSQALTYFNEWYGAESLKWLHRFKFKKNDDLELLTTVDMAAQELIGDRQDVTVAGVKEVIAANKEWRPKLKKPFFADNHIASAIKELTGLFTPTS